MDNLKASVDTLNETMGGKKAPDRVEIEAKQAKEKYQREQDAIAKDESASANATERGDFMGAVVHGVKALGRRAISTNPDTIEGAVNTVNDKAIPQVNPSGKK